MSAIGADEEDVEDAVNADVQDSEADEGKHEPQWIVMFMCVPHCFLVTGTSDITNH